MSDNEQQAESREDNLLRTIKTLREEILELKEENESLWSYMEEQKASTNSIGDKLIETVKSQIEEEWLRKLKPLGEA